MPLPGREAGRWRPSRRSHPMSALSVRGLTKTYGNGVQALKGIDLDVEAGDFFALLGPNGAGKTTLIGILTSLAVSYTHLTLPTKRIV